jgi:ABC-2 type transport system permease protein
VLGLSPFHHVALVPAEAFDGVAAAVMVAIAALAAAAAVRRFERRDLVGT